MAHAESMRQLLPQLYRDGELLNGLLALLALQLEIADQDAFEVQRSHWFDACLERDEAEKLGAVLDIPAEAWQSLPQYRDWVHSLLDATLQEGACTKAALQLFITEYTDRFQRTAEMDLPFSLNRWSNVPSDNLPAFIENPLVRRVHKAPAIGGIEPLTQFEVVNRGLDEAKAGFLLTGLSTGPEYVPVIANLTTGQALIVMDKVPTGSRLWIRSESNGLATAMLEGRDITSKLRSAPIPVQGSGTLSSPMQPWPNSSVETPAKAMTLKRGANQLWFLPVAHFDMDGLDRFPLALADLALKQGRFDQTEFDDALFYQEPAVSLQVTWLETRPASFRAELPGGALKYRSGALDSALKNRDILESSLVQAINRLRPAGVEASVQMRPFQSVQPQGDRLTAVLPLVHREGGPMGADKLPETGGLFEVTRFEDSTFR